MLHDFMHIMAYIAKTLVKESVYHAIRIENSMKM